MIDKNDLFKNAGHELYSDVLVETPIVNQDGQEEKMQLNPFDVNLIREWESIQLILSNPEKLKSHFIEKQRDLFLEQIELKRKQLLERGLSDYVEGRKTLGSLDDVDENEDQNDR